MCDKPATKLIYVGTPEKKQQACQDFCLEDPECIGISHTYHMNYNYYCLLCKDDKLKGALYDISFFRRPGGKFQLKQTSTLAHL